MLKGADQFTCKITPDGDNTLTGATVKVLKEKEMDLAGQEAKVTDVVMDKYFVCEDDGEMEVGRSVLIAILETSYMEEPV